MTTVDTKLQRKETTPIMEAHRNFALPKLLFALLQRMGYQIERLL